MVTTLAAANPFAASSSDVFGVFTYIVVAVLIAVLMLKEFVSIGGGERRHNPRLQFLSRVLNAPIFALLVVFLVIVTVRAWQIL